MKKNFKFFIFLILFFICAISFGSSFSVLNANTNITSSDFEDAGLYLYLTHLNNGETLTPSSFASRPTLDLSYNVVNYNESVNLSFSSLKGLEKFDFSNLNTFNASGHKISSITNELNSMVNLQTLNLSNNSLNSVNLQSLEKLNNINLSYNKFNNWENIQLFNFVSPATINLTNNYLSVNNIPVTTNTLLVGLQGVKNNEQFNSSASISFLPYEDIISVSIYKGETLVKTIPYEENSQTFNTHSLSYGEYTIKYNSQTSVSLPENVTFKVKVPSPTIKFFQNNEEVEPTLKIYKETTISFIGEGDIYITHRGKTEKTNTFNIKDYGTYTITYYQVVNGDASEERTLTVISNVNAFVQWIYIVVGIVLFVIAIRLVLLYLRKPAKGKIQKREKF